MSGTGELDDRDEGRSLRDDLRALDPASSLPPADPAGLARLLEDTMSDQSTDESRIDGTHHRSRLTWLVGAAAVVVIAAGAAAVLVDRGGDEAPLAGPGASSSGPEGAAGEATVTELTFDGQVDQGRCRVPEPSTVSDQSLAFDGVVTSVSGGMVTLEPSKYYTGDPTDLVTVKAPSRDLQLLLSAVDFEEGKRYIVAANDGRLTLCGYSDVYSERLDATYTEGFRR